MVLKANRRAGGPATRLRPANLVVFVQKVTEIYQSVSCLKIAAVLFQSVDLCYVKTLVYKGTPSLAFDLAGKEHVIVWMVGSNC